MPITKPVIPQTVIRFTGDEVPRVPPSFADVVAVPIIHDWGPLLTDAPGADGKQGGVQLCTSFAEFTSLFGDSDTPGRTAVAGAFAGQGLLSGDGAGGVLVARMGTNAAAAAHIDVNNTAPAVALTLTARYKGVRGNDISYAIDADPNNSSNDRLRIRYKGAVVETYSYARTAITSLRDQINASPSLVIASAALNGTALATTAGTSLAGGNDGSVITSTEHLAALAALEFKPFSLLAPYDLTDSAIQASYLSWVQTQAAANRPVVLCVGGAAGETLNTAVTRSTALADEHVVNLGVGTYHDDLLGKDLSTSQLAPRIAGILAARGEEKSLTRARIAGLHVVGATAPATSQIETAILSGVTALMHTSSADAELCIAKGVTTFTDPANAAKPLDVFSDPRLVRIMDIYVRGMKQWGDDVILGNVPVNQSTRDAVRGEGRRRQDDLLDRGLILPGDGVTVPKPFVIADDPGDPALADAVPYSFGWQFARTANFIIGDGKIR